MRKPVIRKLVDVGSYKSVNLSKGKHRKMWRVHRLVCMTFNENKHNTDLIIDHINNDKHDNRACNLEWVTHKDNILRAVQDGLIVTTFDKLKSYRFKKLKELGFSYRKIAKWNNTSHGVISSHVKRYCNAP